MPGVRLSGDLSLFLVSWSFGIKEKLVLEQDEIIRRFVKKYNDCQSTQFQITRWPDKEPQRSRACDAYAEASGIRPLAIEHTNVQSFHRQKQDSARFLKVCGTLETELKNAFSFDVTLIIPTFGIETGTNWNAIKNTLCEWLIANVESLPLGCSVHQVDRVSFPITIEKYEGSGFYVARWKPPDIDTKNELVQIVGTALDDKNDQLREYHANGAETILILESDDIALVNPTKLYKAYLQASECIPTPNIDQVWLARTFDPEDSCIFYYFYGPEAMMDKVNPRNYRFGPRYSAYWAEIRRREQVQL